MNANPRISIVVLTYNRADELMGVLHSLQALPERPEIIVVDNASTDGTAERVRAEHPQVRLVREPTNRGAAGRNSGVAQVRTPYVAFCDDDTWWAPGALARAADLLDAHPRVAALNARVIVEPEGRTDPTCDVMAHSPLDARGLPGPALVGFMAGAVVMRTTAFLEAGGYEPRFFLGAEEALLAFDLQARGWALCYRHDMVTHHHPSPARDLHRRRASLIRNRLWLAWLRLPLAVAWDETRSVLRDARQQGLRREGLRAAMAGLPWVLRQRRVLPPQVVRDWWLVHRGGALAADAPSTPVVAQRQ
ncbi:MAG: glycosyltransferase family 2 protein [Aquincola tertiaricarbonis]|uniref:glycosyltransferase family 2 protein n=1 Tax=Aquincola tertiaricarbonis TaxID=391953 RepID=UPI000614DDAB|nr:glycosyltransferase family 2 protein [Aquincola tertiaricarbonis]